MWVSMQKGQVTLPVFQSLEAYWPGLLVGVVSSSLFEPLFTSYVAYLMAFVDSSR